MINKPVILAVDDDPDSLALLAEMLTPAGYEVRPTDSGELALAAVAANPPDLILLDVRMKGVDGIEVCRRLKAREETRRIPIILISAFADGKEWLTGLQLGAADYITKPFQSEELLMRVKTQLTLSRANVLLDQQRVEDELRQSLDMAERSRRAMLGTLEDQKRIEEILNREQEFTRTLLDNIADGVVACDAKGRLVLFNRAAREWHGMDALGLPPEEWGGRYDLYGPDETTPLPTESIPLIRAFHGETVRDAGMTIAAKGQPIRHILATGCPFFDARHNLLGAVAVMRDITGIKRSAEALNHEQTLMAALMLNLPDAVYFKDTASRFLRVNPAHARWFGLSDPAQMVGKTDADFFTREHAGKALADEQEIMRTGQPLVNIEEKETWPDGSETWVSTTKLPLRDGAGRIIGTCGISSNITERKRSEAALQKSSRELQERNDELARFTYTASHDLKSPLVTIIAFIGYLEQDIRSQDAAGIKKDLGYIYTATDKMSRLLDELLDLARVGRKMNPPEEVPLQVVVKEALDLVAGWIAQRGVEVVVTKEPIVLRGDRQRLVEVFQNLADNAVKFMGDQQNPRVEIGVETIGDERVFFVRDNGMGIDPRYQSKLFGLFEKFDPATKGTGIGLALVKRIVEVHGGRIWVKSDGPGRGSNFLFTLPGAVILGKKQPS